MFKKGDEAHCVVLGIDISNERLSLGIKQLEEDPWRRMSDRYPAGARVHGKITNIADFGLFVAIEDGVEGLVHVSQLGRDRVENPRDHFQVGQELEAEVTQVDVRERRISLSIRSLMQSAEKEEMRAYMADAGTPGRTGGVTLGDMIQEKLARRRGRDGGGGKD
jgi:small subunit ribosomal protein S1